MPTPWLTMSLSFLNRKEVPGPSANPEIIEMYRLCGHKEQDDAVPWCAAFVGACLSLAGYKNTGSLAARSYENFGRDLHGAPQRGAIVVFPRGPASSGKGHVGFVESVKGDQIVYVSGNLSDMVKRDARPKSEMIACRMPIETAPLPQTSLATILQIAPSEAPPHVRGGVAQDEIMLPPIDGQAKAIDALAEGAVGPAVESLQKALRAAGFSPGEVDGEFGPNTRNAVSVFQMSQGMPATGVADERTLSRLNISTARPVPILIGPDSPRRADFEQLAERLLKHLVSILNTWSVSQKNVRMICQTEPPPRTYYLILSVMRWSLSRTVRRPEGTRRRTPSYSNCCKQRFRRQKRLPLQMARLRRLQRSPKSCLCRQSTRRWAAKRSSA